MVKELNLNVNYESENKIKKHLIMQNMDVKINCALRMYAALTILIQ